MNNAHIDLIWKNYPSDESPVNEENLNRMVRSINLTDENVHNLDENKASKEELLEHTSKLFKDVQYSNKTGILTFTRKNGETITIDTPLEMVALDIYYDPVTEMLTLPLEGGGRFEVDLSRLITELEFLNSDTIAISVEEGKVRAIVKEGSIEEKHLRPDYLADIRLEQGKAQQSAEDAEGYAKLSESYAHGGTGVREGEDTDNAMEYARQAKESADKAEGIASSSDLADLIKLVGDADIEGIADGTVTGAIKELGGAGAFKIIKLNGVDSDIDTIYDLPAQSVALTYPDFRVGDLPHYDIDDLSGGRWFIVTTGVDMGNRTQLATELYGIRMFYRTIWNEGSQTYGVWHEFVTAVKGSAEREYRSGYVNITPANIGLGNVDNTPDANKDVSSAKQLSGWADTRDVATTPETYSEKFLPVGLKSPVGSGIPGIYSTLLGIRGWKDRSGGKAHELGFTGDGRLMHRVGDEAWEAWREIAHRDNIPTKASDIGAASASHVGVTTNVIGGGTNISYTYPEGKNTSSVFGVPSLNAAISESTQKISGAVVNLGTVFRSPGKTFHPPSGGKWYRLGHVEKDATFYGEFILSHSWNNTPSEAVKFVVGGACSSVVGKSFNIQKIFVSYTGQDVRVKKARVLYYPAANLNNNICVDVFLEHSPSFFEKDDVWYYRLARNSTLERKEWVDDNFADATIPSGYASKEVDLGYSDLSYVECVDFGTYDHLTMSVDNVVKDVFNRAPLRTNKICLGRFILGSAYTIIIQCYDTRLYGSAILLSYSFGGLIFYRKLNGVLKKYTTQWTETVIG